MSNTTVRLVGKGWTTFTGTMGSVPFEDGLSTRDCTQREVDQLAAITRIETVEGDALGIATRLKGGATIPAPVVAPLARQTEKAKVVETHTPAANADGSVPEIKRYTVEELHKVADDKGLAGLRDIATPRGLKGRSINDLVEAILKDQENRFGKLPETPAPVAPTPAPEAPAPEAPAPEAPPAGGDSEAPAENAETETPAIDGEHDANAQAAAALSQSQDA